MVYPNGYHLEYNKFENNTKTTWQNLQTDKNFCDITLACEGKELHAHKIILSSSSPILKNILKQIPNPNPTIFLEGVRYKDLHNLLRYIYQGEVKIASEDLCNFLEVADDLKIRGLSKESEKFSNSNDIKIPKNKNYEVINDNKTELEKVSDDPDLVKSSTDFTEKLSDTEEKENVCPQIHNSRKSEKHCTDNVVSFKNDDYIPVYKSQQEEVVKDNKNEHDKEANDKARDKSATNIIEELLDTKVNNKKDLISYTRKNKVSCTENVVSSQNKYLKFIKITDVMNRNTENSIENSNKSMDISKDDNVGYFENSKKSIFKKIWNGLKHWYKCNVCDYKSKRKQQVEIHVQSLHEKLVLTCDYCNKQYTNPRSLKRHRDLIHLGMRYSCDKCHRQYRDPRGLKEHKETEHEGALYQCEQCDYKAVQTLTLKNHIKSIHEGISYQCDHCDTRLTHKQSLKRHIDAVHAKIIHPCDKCDKEYTDIGDLKKHKVRVHKGDMYSCDKCNYLAVENTSLLRHTKIKHNR